MELWKIILGIVTAIFLIFVKDANAKAHKQINASIRLYSYLIYWKTFVLDNDMFSIFHKGVEWNEKVDKLIKEGASPELYIKVRDDLKSEVFGMKDDFISDENIKVLDQETIDKILSKLPRNAVDSILQYASRKEQNIIDGKTFITDEEASYLGPHTALIAIELKMELINILNSGVGLLATLLSSKDGIDIKEHADEILKLIWKGILISKHIDTLTKKMDYLKAHSSFDLTIKNLKGEL